MGKILRPSLLTAAASEYRSLHGYERPLPELPALDHINEARCLPGRMLRLHAHPTFELCLTVSGRCRWLLTDREVASGPGDLFVAAPGVLHGCRSDARDPNHNLALGFDPGPALQRLDAGGLGGAVGEGRAVFADASDGFRLLPGCLGLEQLFRRILGELDAMAMQRERSRPMALAMIQALLVELCITVTRIGLGELGDARQRGRIPAGVRGVLDWLPGQLSDPPGIAAMARRAGLSPSHFAAQFRRCTGETPIEYLTRLRLEAAAALLARQPRLAIAAVAAEYGFCSGQYFSALFRRRFGRSPAAWRRTQA